jgi:hypothetical protein
MMSHGIEAIEGKPPKRGQGLYLAGVDIRRDPGDFLGSGE